MTSKSINCKQNKYNVSDDVCLQCAFHSDKHKSDCEYKYETECPSKCWELRVAESGTAY